MAEVPAAELKERCRELATAALIARHVPPEGSRHDYAMALAGFVLRDGRMEADLALKVLKAAWHAAGADSREALRDLEGIVSDTAENLEAGEPVVGGPTLEEFAPGIVRLLCKWWGWERKAQTEDKEEKEERRNQADRLIGYALEDVQELFVDQHGAPHALIGGEPVPLTSRCYSWLRRLMWEEEGRSVSGEYLKMAAGTLSAHAEFSGEVRGAPHPRGLARGRPLLRAQARQGGAGGARRLDLRGEPAGPVQALREPESAARPRGGRLAGRAGRARKPQERAGPEALQGVPRDASARARRAADLQRERARWAPARPR